jgi:hypothetical protein
VDDEEIPPSLHGGAFAYLEDKYHPSPTLSIKIDPCVPFLSFVARAKF